ncbi:MAG: hypothetical protein AAGH87_00305 [Pseudomonadota bacterium]
MTGPRAICLAVVSSALVGCENLPIEFPGQTSGGVDTQPASSDVTTPQPAAATSDASVRASGLDGAALCISSAYYLADLGAVPEESGVAIAERWIDILEVIPAQVDDQRQSAVDDRYVLLRQLDRDGSGAGFDLARLQFENDTCTSVQFQRDYLRRWGDPTLMSAQLEGGS